MVYCTTTYTVVLYSTAQGGTRVMVNLGPCQNTPHTVIIPSKHTLKVIVQYR